MHKDDNDYNRDYCERNKKKRLLIMNRMLKKRAEGNKADKNKLAKVNRGTQPCAPNMFQRNI